MQALFPGAEALPAGAAFPAGLAPGAPAAYRDSSRTKSEAFLAADWSFGMCSNPYDLSVLCVCLYGVSGIRYSL